MGCGQSGDPWHENEHMILGTKLWEFEPLQAYSEATLKAMGVDDTQAIEPHPHPLLLLTLVVLLVGKWRAQGVGGGF